MFIGTGPAWARPTNGLNGVVDALLNSLEIPDHLLILELRIVLSNSMPSHSNTHLAIHSHLEFPSHFHKAHLLLPLSEVASVQSSLLSVTSTS